MKEGGSEEGMVHPVAGSSEVACKEAGMTPESIKRIRRCIMLIMIINFTHITLFYVQNHITLSRRQCVAVTDCFLIKNRSQSLDQSIESESSSESKF